MKQFIFTNIVLLLLSASAHAAPLPISVGKYDNIFVANSLIGSSTTIACETDTSQANCDFVKTGPIEALNTITLTTMVTSNPASYVASPDKANTYLDLGFDGFDIFTGASNDIVVFMVGNAFSFGFDIFDTAGGILSSGEHVVTTSDTVTDSDGNWLCVNGSDDICSGGLPLSAVFFDIGDQGTQIERIRISLGEDFNAADGSRPRFSLAGGFHTEATVVPLPLSVILFSSGLALLGWVGRRKSV